MRYYLFNVTITSTGTEDRKLVPYDNLETAQRKYHEALTGIGAGSRRIAVSLLDYNLNVIKKEVWQQQFSITLVDGENVSEIRVNAGDEVTLPTNKESGLIGWSETEGSTVTVNNPYTADSDITLYSVYEV